MRVKVDLESDALYFRLTEDPIKNSEEISPGIIVDFNKKGKVVGIEILKIKGIIPLEELTHLTVELPTHV
jgi:uncharacterized protein YuzE